MACLGAAGLATRAVLRTPGYHSIDAGLLARGIESYDFASYHPHPPFYPLVIALGNVLALWMEPLDALLWLAVIASAALVAGTFLVGFQLAGRWVGLLAALLVLASPIALRNGTAPLSYALEGAAATFVAAVAWQTRRTPDARWAAALGLATSVAVGIRPSSLVLLAPLALWGVWGSVPKLRWAVVAGAGATLVWLVPAIGLGGGWAEFRYGLEFQTRFFILAQPTWRGGWPAIETHLAWLAYHMRRGLPFVAVLTLAAVVAGLPLVRRVRRTPAGFLVAWLAPGILFYVLVYAGWPVYPDGYLMALLPAMAILAALTLTALWRIVSEPGVATPLRVAAQGVVLLLAVQPVTWLGDWPDALQAGRDASAWTQDWDGLEDQFPPNETALVALYAAPWVALEHPDYLAWFVQLAPTPDGVLHVQVQQSQNGVADKSYFDNLRDGADAPHPIPQGIRRIVVVDGHPVESQRFVAVALNSSSLAGGAQAHWFDARDVVAIEDALASWDTGPLAASREVGPPPVNHWGLGWPWSGWNGLASTLRV